MFIKKRSMISKINKLSYRTIAYASILIGCVSFAILFKWQQTGKPFRMETILIFAIIFLIAVCMIPWTSLFFKYYSKKTHIQIAKQFIPAIVLFWLGFLIISFLIVFSGIFIFFWISKYDLNTFIPHFFYVEFPSLIKSAAFWMLLGSIVFIYILWRKAIDREQKQKEENLIFRYETIKGQVNPHFLFNSLNTLSSLVRTQPEIAEQYINKLASVYRYILENIQKNEVPLQSEIDFINDYFSLQKIRDGEKIIIDIQLYNINDCLVLPISLQVLIENALKHNMATREKPLMISLYYEKGYIVVKNNLQKMANLSSSSGIGLKNLQERLLFTTNKTMIVNETVDEFIVKLPIIAVNENTNC